MSCTTKTAVSGSRTNIQKRATFKRKTTVKFNITRPESGRGNHTSDQQQNGRGRLPGNEVYLNPDDHVVDSARGYKSFPLNEVARPVFVNHYYAGESVAMNRKFIRLEDCDVSVENLMLNRQAQGGNCKYVEHSRNSLKMQPEGRTVEASEQQKTCSNKTEIFTASL